VKSAGYGPPIEPPRVLGRPRINPRAAPAPSKPDFGPPSSPSASSSGPRPPRPRSAAGRSMGNGSSGSAPVRRPSPGCYSALVSGPPLEPLGSEHALKAYDGYAVTDLCYTPQASHLIISGSDRTVSAYRLPLGRRGSGAGSLRPLGLAGHQGDISSICPSYTESHSTGGGGGSLLLTTGADRTARLWALGGQHAGAELIRFDRLRSGGG
ncbi:unnamed protein product, partial [Polarella glacialis]